MYSVDEKDKVIELSGVPQSSVGSPMPILLSNEYITFLAYLVEDIIDYENLPSDYFDRTGEQLAIVEFELCLNKRFGSPNDETLSVHPLYSKGLKSYGFFEVGNSSWLRQLEIMNGVHPRHNPERFDQYKHFIFTFHDSMFECIARGFKVDVHYGSIKSGLAEMQKRLFDEG